MKEFKTYKDYYIYNHTLHTQNKIKFLKDLLKANKDNKDDFDYWHYKEAMTNKQYELFKNNDFKKLKELLKKQIEKEKKKLTLEKEEALQDYNKIKELKDINYAIIDVMWSSGRRSMGAYQTYATIHAYYKNGTSKYYETRYTGGCGYDKPSTSTSEVCNEALKIVLLKHYKKIMSDSEKHYKFYAGENGYFSYGVGMSSYETFFKNCGYKVQYISHHNSDITLIITNKRQKKNY